MGGGGRDIPGFEPWAWTLRFRGTPGLKDIYGKGHVRLLGCLLCIPSERLPGGCVEPIYENTNVLGGKPLLTVGPRFPPIDQGFGLDWNTYRVAPRRRVDDHAMLCGLKDERMANFWLYGMGPLFFFTLAIAVGVIAAYGRLTASNSSFPRLRAVRSSTGSSPESRQRRPGARSHVGRCREEVPPENGCLILPSLRKAPPSPPTRSFLHFTMQSFLCNPRQGTYRPFFHRPRFSLAHHGLLIPPPRDPHHPPPNLYKNLSPDRVS
ncbi:hypothetical protein LZ30DRAFT_692343 [Colletotrichum cereale]|nr:hypothetical protein LZ30DRAFT_692343 [Colletotrichum cereale]